MEGIGDDQVLQVLNGFIEEGVDNDALDFISDYINKHDIHDSPISFPEDVISSTALHRLAPPDYQTSQLQHNGNVDINDHSHGMQFRNQAFISPSLPDSPPDSEPYSPPSDCSNKSDSNLTNGNLPSVVTSLNNGYGNEFIPVQQQQHAHRNLAASLSLPPGYGNEMFPLQHTPSPHASPSPQHTPMRVSPNLSSQMPAQSKQARRIKNRAPQPVQSPPESDALPQPQINTQMLPQGPTTYSRGSFTQHQHKKRKHSISPQSSVNPALLNVKNLADILKKEPIKQEPGTFPSCEDAATLQEMLDMQNDLVPVDGNMQLIKFQPFHQMKYMTLLDGNLVELSPPVYRVSADKGFNFSTLDESFVCQKKNHFQVTASTHVSGEPQYVRTADGCMKIDNFYIHFHGIKADSPSTKIRIEQSQADRSKKPFYPVLVELPEDQFTKVTVGRLHFSETTLNNMRKKGKPNPDQRFFMLVVELRAHCGDTNHLISSMVSEKIIVRASNPGQFESDVEYTWQKGQSGDVVFHSGRVGINTDNPEEALTVHGNIKLTGQVMQPSDIRAKENFTEMDSREQLEHVQKMKIYKYCFNKGFADQAGLSDDELEDTGVLAQELREVLPDAVRETGDVILSNGNTIERFLVVNKDRIYMENVGAVKELCKLTDNLENRIDELERVNKKLTKLKRLDSLKSTGSGRSFNSSSTVGSRYLPSKRYTKAPPPPPPVQEEPVCSGKFIQIAIIILVLVMAFCLIAMVALYILEKDEGGQVTPTTSPGVIMPAAGSSFSTTPTSITTAAAANQTDGRTSTTTTTEAPTHPVSPTEPSTTNVPTTTTVPPVTTTMPERLSLTKSGCQNGECEVQCCIQVGNTEGGGGVLPAYVAGQDDPGNTTSDWPQPDKMRVKINIGGIGKTSAKSKLPNDNSNGEAQSQTTVPPNADNWIPRDNWQMNLSDPTNVIYKRRRRGIKEEFIIKEIVIEGQHIDNFTVDERYCNKCERGNYTYTIPVTQYLLVEQLWMNFNTGPLQLMITYCTPAPGKLNDNDHCSKDKKTPEVEAPPTHGLSHRWHLPIGYEFNSQFKFRVHQAVKNEDNDICIKPVSESGTTYTEYTFNFVRNVCPARST